MSFFSFLLGAFLAVTCCLFVFIWHKKQSTKKKLKQYQPASIDSSVKNAKTLLNAANHSYAVDNNALAAVWKSRAAKSMQNEREDLYN
jgi:hypothetical protein